MKHIVFFFSLLAAISLGAAERNIVKQGKSDYVIIYNANQTGVPRYAASDLQLYIQKATGAKLPIVKMEKRSGRPAFLIGFDKVDVPEGFIVRTDGKDIRISGNDTVGNIEYDHWANGARTGTWFGVCDFLEKQLGIRWFMPGELGEYVPKRTDWSVGDLDYNDHPQMKKRSMGYITSQHRKENIKAGRFWLRRNRAGKAESWQGSHSWLHHFKARDYFKDHPEWFAMVGGRRYDQDQLGHGLHMCTTNPEALDQYAKNLIAYRKKWKAPIMLTLSPNDGGVPCQCPKCSALDDGRLPGGAPITTTRMMTYANEVAKRVNKVLPDQKFGLYAYSNYRYGVSKVKVDPHITIELVDNDTGTSIYRESHRKELLANAKAWRKTLDSLHFYTFPEGMGMLELPCCQFNNICMLYDILYEADISGFDMNMPTSFGASALNDYFYLKFAWRMPEDRQKFYEETLRDCYGKEAAPVMKAYFAECERRLSKLGNTKLDEDLGLGYVRIFPGALTIAYPGLAEEWLPKLKAAAAKTTDKGQKARIQIAVTNLELCGATVALYQTAQKVVGRSKPDVKAAAEALKLIKKRDELQEKLKALPGNLRLRGAYTDKHYHLPFDPAIYTYMLAANAKQSAKIERRKDKPVMDGKLDDAFWSKLPVLRIQYNKDNGERFKVGSNVKIARVGDELFIGIHCEEPFMNKVTDSAKDPKAAIWDENAIELFFAPPNSKKCGQLIFNAIGTQRFFLYEGNKTLVDRFDAAEIKITKEKNGWNAEVRLPLSVLTEKKIRPGDIWGMNFCRTRRTVRPNEYAAWSPTFGLFRVPERFGKAIFR